MDLQKQGILALTSNLTSRGLELTRGTSSRGPMCRYAMARDIGKLCQSVLDLEAERACPMYVAGRRLLLHANRLGYRLPDGFKEGMGALCHPNRRYFFASA